MSVHTFVYILWCIMYMYLVCSRCMMGMYACGGMYIMCTYVFVYQRVCMVACHSDTDPLARFRPVTRDTDWCPLWTQYMAIRKLIHGMIRRSVLVRPVKSRQRFGSKITSFHVSVCSYVIFLFTVLFDICVFIRNISRDCLMYFIAWILVSLHETLLIIQLICVVDMSLYQYHFMCW